MDAFLKSLSHGRFDPIDKPKAFLAPTPKATPRMNRPREPPQPEETHVENWMAPPPKLDEMRDLSPVSPDEFTDSTSWSPGQQSRRSLSPVSPNNEVETDTSWMVMPPNGGSVFAANDEQTDTSWMAMPPDGGSAKRNLESVQQKPKRNLESVQQEPSLQQEPKARKAWVPSEQRGHKRQLDEYQVKRLRAEQAVAEEMGQHWSQRGPMGPCTPGCDLDNARRWRGQKWREDTQRWGNCGGKWKWYWAEIAALARSANIPMKQAQYQTNAKYGGDPRKSGPLASEAVGKGSAASSSAKIEVGSGSTASSAKCAVGKKWT